jgi:hypothetical protein
MRIRHALLLVAALVVAGCASVSPGGALQHTGEATVFDLAMVTDLEWARIRGIRMEQWTIDGSPLNQLTIVSRVKPGEHVFLSSKQTRSRPDGAWFRAGMRPDEVRDVIVDAMTGDGWANVVASGLRPDDVGGVPGLRFDLDLDSPRGLVYRGTAAAVEREGRLTILIWIAPAEYYHGRDVQAVSAMLDSLRFTD